ncbi:nucleoside 2-deoxyribosyltransferase domain-containing protein [Seonamhaeicola marinus]|uniref:Uncharacterized protein n=1 Tax=Seonamhaeicola marinus TaxID=1912246 RepID=A0A5D0I4K0_9FLAO|nr:nucleoside 2-deoxyribosyltransferase domain-containing protein [Seonamhaeicola marinus]TYA78616.1 hypothetical protein FUA24_09700 [Seonamhaeicola marinus]
MIYTPHNQIKAKETHKDYVFLAGSIDLNLDGNWREQVINLIGDKVHFIDPTISGHDAMNDLQMESHINWELDMLDLADKVFLNFLEESKSPISLVELGMYTRTSKLIVVCPNAFYKSRYIKTLCKKYKIPLFTTLDAAVRTSFC